MVSLSKILIGIVLIGALYLIPISKKYSISSLASMCNNAIGALLGGSQCQFYIYLFYLGWIVGIVLILWGLMSPNTSND